MSVRRPLTVLSVMCSVSFLILVEASSLVAKVSLRQHAAERLGFASGLRPLYEFTKRLVSQATAATMAVSGSGEPVALFHVCVHGVGVDNRLFDRFRFGNGRGAQTLHGHSPRRWPG